MLRSFYIPTHYLPIQFVKNWYLCLFLLVCFIFGSSSQDNYMMKLPIYLLSILAISGILISQPLSKLSSLISIPLLTFAAFIFLTLIYLIPLPLDIWSSLSGREKVIEGYAALNLTPKMAPLSLTPEKTALSFLGFLPPIAIAAIVAVSPRENINRTIPFIIILAVLSILLGFLQMFTGSHGLYLYSTTNFGKPVGLFSNVNHQACFIVIATVLLMYVMTKKYSLHDSPINISPLGLKIMQYATLALFIFGVMMTGSIAGIALLLTATTLAGLKLHKNKALTKRSLIILSSLVVFLILNIVFLEGLWGQIIGKLGSESTLSRITVLKDTLAAKEAFGFFGTGPGSFADIYRMFENREDVTWFYMPHAHNDYLQIYLELGILGLGTAAIFLCWFFASAIKSIFTKGSNINTILLIAIGVPLLHSFVDYPMRTLSISALFAFLVTSYVKYHAKSYR